MMRDVFILLACGVAGLACNNDEAPAGDGGAGDGDAPLASEAVSACRAEAARVASPCGERDRACFFRAYAGLCNDERAEAVSASLRCFRADACRTFADPSDDALQACLVKSYADHETSASKQAREAFCGLCDCSAPGAEGVPFAHLTSAVNENILSCLATAKSCGDAERCQGAALPELVSCFAPAK